MTGIRRRFKNLKLQRKLIMGFLLSSLFAIVVNVAVYMNLNEVVRKIDEVYSTNASINDITENIAMLHDNLTEYLRTKGTDELEQYYKCSQILVSQTSELNRYPMNNRLKQMERTIRNLSDNYLKKADEAVKAKRGRNIVKYTSCYEECVNLYGYLSTYLYSLNNEQFKSNSSNYNALLTSLSYSEIFCLSIFGVVSITNVIFIIMLTRSITRPLILLSKRANEVSEGKLDTVEPLEVTSDDEIGTVTHAFNQMLLSIRKYIVTIREQMETESIMKENELLMENHLKDAQLKYLQAQINPHFLFNTLNAGAQLAMLEGADRTNEYIQHMADFFRYNVKKNNDEVEISEEIELVDSYIYILNVRFSGEIKFFKDIDEKLLSVRVPSMIIQPLVENSVKYGITGLEREGRITLSLYEENGRCSISVSDNGRGMDSDRIKRILRLQEGTSENGDTDGVGLKNVMTRLNLFYSGQETFDIKSEPDCGTEVIITVPMACEQEESAEDELSEYLQTGENL